MVNLAENLPIAKCTPKSTHVNKLDCPSAAVFIMQSTDSARVRWVTAFSEMGVLQ